MKMKIALIGGDGIGPEVVAEAVKVLQAVGQKFSHQFDFEPALAGGAAYDQFGTPLPQETMDTCNRCQALLFGAVGGPKWDQVERKNRPESGLLGLRKGLGLFCNLRPAVLYKQLSSACTLRPDIIGDGLNIMVVRELTGDIYFGEHKRSADGTYASDLMNYSVPEIERIARLAFDIAMKRSKKVTSVDKANVLETSRLWRETVARIALEFPEVTLDNLYVDNASMQLVRNPHQFDVILTGNMFGDILSDEASMITGSIGMLPSASLRADHYGMYEPIHGSAPDIAGQGKANPIATILSAGMMLRYTFNLAKEADAVEKAVSDVLDEGWRSADIFSDGMKLAGTEQMGTLIVEKVMQA